MGEILCIVDGMTDPGFLIRDYPNLASMGQARLFDTCRGQPPESLGCILRLLGVQRVPAHLRGYAEALGCGIPAGPGDLILRGSWFALDECGRCTVPAVAPPSLSGSGDFRYYPLGQYKSLLVLPGMAAFVKNVRTRPPHQCAGLPAEALCPTGCGALSRIFRDNLRDGRCLIPWGASVCAAMPPFPKKSAVVCGTAVVRGIARLLNMTLLEVPGATGDVDTDLPAKARAAVSAAEDCPFVLLHINGADEAAHRRDPGQKAAFLRRVDALVLPVLLRSGHRVRVTADHGTDPVTGRHLSGLQPVYTSGQAGLETPPARRKNQGGGTR